MVICCRETMMLHLYIHMPPLTTLNFFFFCVCPNVTTKKINSSVNWISSLNIYNQEVELLLCCWLCCWGYHYQHCWDCTLHHHLHLLLFQIISIIGRKKQRRMRVGIILNHMRSWEFILIVMLRWWYNFAKTKFVTTTTLCTQFARTKFTWKSP